MAKRKKPKKPVLAHHRHTGKLLPREHTSWPFVVLLILMVGVLFTQITFQAKAADVAVTAAANGPLPPTPATITSPQNGASFSQIPITVSGTCPSPYLVKLFRNGVFTGSAQCQPDGTFTITTDLFQGENELQARIYNYADQEGPTSPAVTVTYNPPSASTPSGSTPGQPGQSVEGPFFITTDKFFKANLDKPRIDWDFGIVGGAQPFSVIVDWGDGSTTRLDNFIGNQFSVAHLYVKGNQAREYYPMLVKVTDTKGRVATLQTFNILNYSIAAATTAPGGNLPSGDTSQGTDNSLLQLILFIWPAFGALILMAASFWLGQHVLAAPAAAHYWSRKFKPPQTQPRH